MSFANLTASLDLNISNFASNLAKASQSMNKFASDTAGKYDKLNTAVKKHALGLKDVSRIVQGIVISQVFYSSVNAIEAATSSVWKFNEALDYAHVTYTALFSDQKLATDFLTALKEYSIETIYSFEELTAVSKKLLSYGIDYDNLLFIQKGITNIATMSGDTDALQRTAKALGQIYTQGYLKAQEMHQLADAAVPIYKIIQEKFGLTDEQMASVGDLRLPAEDVINAVVDYANEKFGGVADAAMLTITGLNNKVKDGMMVLGAEMLQPAAMAYKSFMNAFANQLENIRGIYADSGIGGIFEYLVPNPETQQRIRQFLGAVISLFQSVARLISALWPLAKQILAGFANTISLLMPVITHVINLLYVAIGVITANEEMVRLLSSILIVAALAWTAFKVKALAALAITAVTKAITGVSAAVLMLSKVLVRSPILGIGALVLAIIIAISANSEKAKNALQSFMNTLTGFSGVDVNDVLEPVDKAATDGADALEQFNNRVGDLNNNLEETEKAAEKAAKGLLSFDEVFTLSNNATTIADATGIGAILDGIKEFSADMLPEIPDFSTYTDKFADGLYGSLFGSLQRIGAGAGSGLLIGGLFGFAIGAIVTKTMAGAMAGAKLGMKIGSVAGGALAGFFPDMYSQIEGSLNKVGTGMAIGALLGGLAGFVIGGLAFKSLKAAQVLAKYGASIGTFIGGGLGLFWAGATEEMEKSLKTITIVTSVAGLVGGLVGMVIGALAMPDHRFRGAMTGAGWGSTIGTVLAGGITAFWTTATDDVKKTIAGLVIGTAIAGFIGGVVGMIIGAVATPSDRIGGAMAGAKLGSLLGSTFSLGLSGAFDEVEKSLNTELGGLFSAVQGAAYGALIGGLLGLIIGAIVGAFAGGIGALPGAKAGASIGAAAGGLVGAVINYMRTEIDWSAVSTQLSRDVKKAWSDAFNPESWASGWSTVSEWFKNLLADIKEWFGSLGTTISKLWDDLWHNGGSGKAGGVTFEDVTYAGGRQLSGHATGGIFNREHIARFAEGNKAEAVIPLQNAAAMQPFVNAIADGITSSLAPMLAVAGGGSDMPPVYVGTLVADDKGLKELERKLRIIRVKEERRGS